MTCSHVSTLPPAVEPDSPDGCADCRGMGEESWAHLRMCLSCGHVACCDSSPYRHASAHFAATRHPVMRSFEPGESWRWCFVDGRIVG